MTTRVPVEPDLIDAHLRRIQELVERSQCLDLPQHTHLAQLAWNLDAIRRNVEILKALHADGRR